MFMMGFVIFLYFLRKESVRFGFFLCQQATPTSGIWDFWERLLLVFGDKGGWICGVALPIVVLPVERSSSGSTHCSSQRAEGRVLWLWDVYLSTSWVWGFNVYVDHL